VVQPLAMQVVIMEVRAGGCEETHHRPAGEMWRECFLYNLMMGATQAEKHPIQSVSRGTLT